MPFGRAVGAVVAGLLLAVLTLLIVYVLRDDAYLNDGTSRWASRAGDADARAALWSALALTVVSIPVLPAGIWRRRVVPTLAGALLAGLALAADAFAFVGFTAN